MLTNKLSFRIVLIIPVTDTPFFVSKMMGLPDENVFMMRPFLFRTLIKSALCEKEIKQAMINVVVKSNLGIVSNLKPCMCKFC